MKNNILRIIGLIIGITIFVSLIACSNNLNYSIQATTTVSESRLLYSSGDYVVYVFTDRETGMEYLVTIMSCNKSISITPRLEFSNKYNGYSYNENYEQIIGE